MNPLTNTRNITKLSQKELSLSGGKTSWHDEYRDSAWIFVGGLPYDLSEGDVIAVFSQYGEIVNINMVRDKVTGKQKGFAFICYEDQRSTILAVDNFNGIKILSRVIRVDHVKDYKPPKDSDKLDDDTRKLMAEGCAPKMASDEPPSDNEEFLLERRMPDTSLKQIKLEPSEAKLGSKKHKSEKKSKKSKKKSSKHKSKKRRRQSSSSDSASDTDSSPDRHRRKR